MERWHTWGIAEYSDRAGETFDEEVEIQGNSFQVSAQQYLPNAVQSLEEDEAGVPILSMVSMVQADLNLMRLLNINVLTFH